MRFLLALGLILLSLGVQAQTGFECPDLKLTLSRADRAGIGTLVVTDTVTRAERINERVVLPLDQSTDAYQERWGTYLTIMNEAQLRFPYMPEFLLVFHAMKSSKLYRAGFKAFEGEGRPVKLSKMYCRAFIEALESF